MNTIERIAKRVRTKLPAVQVEIDAPVDSLGAWFLDVRRPKRPTIVLEWRARHGTFGISSRDVSVPFEGPDEVYEDEDLAAGRVIELVTTGGGTSEPAALELHRIRERFGISQAAVAKALGVSQAAVSRIENRRDMLLSTLRRYLTALGTKADVLVRVKDREVLLAEAEGAPAPTRSRSKKR